MAAVGSSGRWVPLALAAMLALAVSACSSPPGNRSAPSAQPPSPPSEETSPPGKGTPVPDRLTAGERAALDSRLLAAAWRNDLAAARRLIRAGADVNAKDETGQSAYLVATSEGYLRLLELTLGAGADVRSLDGFDGTGLIRAAERGHADIVGRLLQTDISVNHVNNLGWTALHEAIVLGDGSQGYVDTVRLLVAGGADVRLPPERDGIAPVEHARSRGFGEIAQTLDAAAAGPVGAPRSLLLAAATRGDADAVALAIRAGGRIETRDERGRTPLLLAAANDRLAAARLLVALGADPDALDERHDTPWLVTGVTGSVPMLEILLPAGPDLTLVNRFGGISVIPASERGHVDYVRRVVRTSIDVNHVNDLGWTALLEAVILGDGSRPYRQIVRSLLAAGASPDIADADGVTALEHARSRGFDDLAALLEEA